MRAGVIVIVVWSSCGFEIGACVSYIMDSQLIFISIYRGRFTWDNRYIDYHPVGRAGLLSRLSHTFSVDWLFQIECCD